eukprot:11215918-Lingulodinium_polyedra.AAC.1
MRPLHRAEQGNRDDVVLCDLTPFRVARGIEQLGILLRQTQAYKFVATHLAKGATFFSTGANFSVCPCIVSYDTA